MTHRRNAAVASRRGMTSGLPRMVGLVAVLLAPLPLAANGLGEDRPWGFRTSADRANLAAVTDIIEKWKGGYYDGFETIINSTTTNNIGTQINCNNVANATGSQATNSPSGNAPSVDANTDVGSDSTGNTSDNTPSGDGTNTATNDQSNDGSVTSETEDNQVTTQTGPINNGQTDNDLHNDQHNSGEQYAGVEDSQACAMDGSTFAGDVQSDVAAAISGIPLN